MHKYQKNHETIRLEELRVFHYFHWLLILIIVMQD